MADKKTPDQDQLPVAPARTESVEDRRAFVRKAAGVGLPVVFATVASRTVWARQDGSAGGSVAPSLTMQGPVVTHFFDA